ncbi:hypothetical protein, partial [Staphylococcus pasteuri_A]
FGARVAFFLSLVVVCGGLVFVLSYCFGYVILVPILGAAFFIFVIICTLIFIFINILFFPI